MPNRDHIEWQDRSAPLAYLITFRCYGTWLHGDERGSADRRFYNRYGVPKIGTNAQMEMRKAGQLKGGRFFLDAARRQVVDQAIREVCDVRRYRLFALNVRTEHVHVVPGSGGPPERMMDSFKAFATRALRANGLCGAAERPWSRHGSTRYLWTEEHIAAAVEYVVNGQGGELPTFD